MTLRKYLQLRLNILNPIIENVTNDILNIPSTPNNDKIFDYANNLSKLNKFRCRFDAEVYGDGTLIFEGTLTLNGFKDKKYKCNLHEHFDSPF